MTKKDETTEEKEQPVKLELKRKTAVWLAGIMDNLAVGGNGPVLLESARQLLAYKDEIATQLPRGEE